VLGNGDIILYTVGNSGSATATSELGLYGEGAAT